MRWRLPVLALTAGLLAGCSGLGGANDDPGALVAPSTNLSLGEGIVIVKNISYNPARISVPVGREVVWTIDDSGVNHSVTADDNSFDSGKMTSGQFKHAFGAAGEVAYHCTVHAKMKGTVVVS